MTRFMSRRQFHRYAGSAAGALGIGGLAGPSARGAAQRGGPYIDIHTHLGRVWNRLEPMTPARMLKWMDRNNVEQAVNLPLASPESSSYLLTSSYVLEQTRPHRDRLIPFCCMDPRTSYRGGASGALDMLRRWKDAGARGFGEHKPGTPIDDRRSMILYEGCAELELPVLFHLDNRRNTDRPGLPGLEKVLKAFPTLPFIGHANGWWASISGDVTQAQFQQYPKTPVAPGGAIDRLMDAYPNLYGDLSAGSGHNAITRDPGFGRAFLERRADRLLFGTDYLHPGQKVPQLDLYAGIDLPAKAKRLIFRDNARRLLGLS